MVAGNQIIPVEEKALRGGYRTGAGRPKGSRGGKILTGRELGLRLERLQRAGTISLTSGRVLQAVGDAEYWLHLIAQLERAEEWGMLVDVLKFHQQMRDGRPPQQINITSQSVTYTPDEIARIRAVARTLAAPVASAALGNTVADAVALLPPSTADSPVKHNGG